MKRLGTTVEKHADALFREIRTFFSQELNRIHQKIH